MAKLSDTIEAFILSLFQGDESSIDLRRNELAEYFGCVPSQINYVIATRFTLDKGYQVESKKGGGGYVRIIKMDTDKDAYLHELLTERIGSSLTFREAEDMVCRMAQNGYLDEREKELVLAVLKDIPIPIHGGYKDILRAGIFKNILVWLLRTEEG